MLRIFEVVFARGGMIVSDFKIIFKKGQNHLTNLFISYIMESMRPPAPLGASVPDVSQRGTFLVKE
jgi:hypothetical protein